MATAGELLRAYREQASLGARDAIAMLVLKIAHDRVRTRNERLVERYVEIVGRISALVVGTIAIEMVLQGVDAWLATRG